LEFEDLEIWKFEDVMISRLADDWQISCESYLALFLSRGISHLSSKASRSGDRKICIVRENIGKDYHIYLLSGSLKDDKENK
jgi:hypothetical protein